MHVKAISNQYYPQFLQIHNKHFKDEFELSELFDDKVLNKFVITDDDDKVVTFGGIKLLFELACVTDLDRTPRERVVALKTFLDTALSQARKKQFEQLHCFATHNIEDNKWVGMLEKVGFSQTKGRALYINL